MYLDFEKKRLPIGAIEEKKTKSGGRTYAIWWNKVPSIVMTYDKINQVLDTLDNQKITYQETKAGAYTISRTRLLSGYFIRIDKDDCNRIEVCGLSQSDGARGDALLFRCKISQSYIEEFGALDAWFDFKEKVNKHCGRTLHSIFGGLPQVYHQYRGCVPSPINWASSALTAYRGTVSEKAVKADICSAYGTEASKTLPDCHPGVIRHEFGKIAPTAEYPFAFYLHSGHMAVYQEGDTYQLNDSRYITCDHTIFVRDSEEETLLCPPAQYTLYDVFTELYEGRKDNPNNKGVMNMTIGMFHRRRWTEEQDNLWPLAAVIKFRCNKRIVDTCEWLRERGQHPILINTDSILWEGEIIPEMVNVFSTEKKLGNFCYEYRDCVAVIRSPKVYQILDNETGETITRWSGSHTKKYTSMLRFGQIWDNDVYDYLRELENKNTIKWDKTKRRYINKLGENYSIQEDLPQWIINR